MFTFSKSKENSNIRGYRGVIAAGQSDLDQELPDLDGGTAPLGLDGDIADIVEATTHAPGDTGMTSDI